MKHLVTALLLVTTPALAFAQEQASGPVLTLEEAINLALRNNPQHLQRISARSRSGTALRSAYGALLPTVNSSLGFGFREGGSELAFGQQFGAPSDILSSSYSISLNASYSLSSFLQPRVAHANLDAAEADVRASAQQTRALVAQQYLRVLQAQATAALQDTLVANAQTQLELDRARQQVGAATVLEVRNSEVQLAQARVAQLRARNDVEIQMLTLFQQIGIERP
ncbi:MAG TPA: TolC family protein, partial [Gemmatimonadaceae bacterium]